MSSKITNAEVLAGIETLRGNMKARKFTETIELQVALKDYDPQKDKRFVGSVRLPNMPRPTLKICLIADAVNARTSSLVHEMVFANVSFQLQFAKFTITCSSQ